MSGTLKHAPQADGCTRRNDFVIYLSSLARTGFPRPARFKIRFA
jgi:hypothetical protein